MVKENNQTYVFRIPNKKLAIKSIAIYGGLILGTLFLGEDYQFIPLGVAVLGIIPLIILMVKRGIAEKVTLTETGIYSANYGKIDFSQVRYVYSIYGRRGTVVTVKLNGWKTYRWPAPIYFASEKFPEESANFYGFFHQLPKLFEAYQARNKSKSDQGIEKNNCYKNRSVDGL